MCPWGGARARGKGNTITISIKHDGLLKVVGLDATREEIRVQSLERSPESSISVYETCRHQIESLLGTEGCEEEKQLCVMDSPKNFITYLCRYVSFGGLLALLDPLCVQGTWDGNHREGTQGGDHRKAKDTQTSEGLQSATSNKRIMLL